MIRLARVDLSSDILSGTEYPSRTLWDVDYPGRPSTQTGRKLLFDGQSQVVLVDDKDLIPISYVARMKVMPAPANDEPPPESTEQVVTEWSCGHCSRLFGSQKALIAHQRFCKPR